MAGESPLFHLLSLQKYDQLLTRLSQCLRRHANKYNGRRGKHSAKLGSGVMRRAVAPADKHPSGIKKHTPASFAAALRR